MQAIRIDSDDSEVQWGVDRVDAEKVHTDTTGSGADIAILDTGIDSDHPDLLANLGSGKAYVSARGPYAEDWDDDNGHGTHCAGIADAVDNSEGVVGVSTEATLHAVKVLDKNGTGSYSDITAGIKYVADQGWDIGSMSFGGGRSSSLADACEYAYNKGVLLVAAAGNDGCESDYTIYEHSCDGCVSAPASYRWVVAVSSTDRDDSISGFSSAGCAVELAAPGRGIYSTVPGGYGTKSGTSMACPHVSGAGGLLMSTGLPNADNQSNFDNPGGARGRLRDTAVRETYDEKTLVPSDMERNNLYGFGLLDVEAAVTESIDSAPNVSWVNPSSGDEVSGSVTVQIDASDTEDSDDSLAVEYRVDGGSWQTAAYNSTSGYYEDSWDSTAVSDGDHTIDARATDSAGNSSTATITVSTENTDNAPSVSWVNPSDGDSVSGSVSLQIEASDDRDGGNDLTVEWEVDNEGWTSASYDSTSGYYEASWDSTSVSDGDHNLDARAVDTAGNTSSEARITVTVSNTGSAPTIDSYEVSEAGSPNPHAEITADWTVGDADGDLDTVVIDVIDATGTVVDSTTNAVSGSTATGSDQFTVKQADGETFDVKLTVSDSNSATADTTETKQVTE
jgi:subtilisin